MAPTNNDPLAADIIIGVGCLIVPGGGEAEGGAVIYQIGAHALERMAERQVTGEMIKATIENGASFSGREAGTIVHTLDGAGPNGRNLLVVTSAVTKKIITVIDMNAKNFTKALRKLKR